MKFERRAGVAPVVLVVLVVVIIVAGVGVYYVATSSSSSSPSTTSAAPTTSATHSSTSSAPPATSTTSVPITSTSATTSFAQPTTSTTAVATSTTSAPTTTASATSTVATTSQGTTETETTYSCSATSATTTGVVTDYTPQYIATVKTFSAMEFTISGTYNGTSSNATLGYTVTSASGGIYTGNITESTSGETLSYIFSVDANNNTVLSISAFGTTFTGSEAKTFFDGAFALFGLQYTYGGALGLYTSSSYFHSTGTASQTFGTTTFQVTTYEANTLPETITACGSTSTLTAYTLGVGTPPGTSLPFITYLHVAGTDSSGSFDDTFQLVSMTVA